MFLDHFSMTAHPFCENPPIEWLLTDDRFQEGLSRLHFTLNQGSLALVLGQTGIGKSSLLRLFKSTMPKNRYHAIHINLTSVTPTAFLRMMLTRLGESPRLGKDRLFAQIIDRLRQTEIETVFFIDEAHLTAPQILTDLRLIIGSDDEIPLPLKIILSGQDSLADTLKRSSLKDLLDRITVRCRLPPLKRFQTIAYIDHRLHCAKASEKLFTEDAKSLIHDYAGGVPRQINNIATACLIDAASRNLKVIDDNIVNHVMNEFMMP
jgi:general secretion pathway protein A